MIVIHFPKVYITVCTIVMNKHIFIWSTEWGQLAITINLQWISQLLYDIDKWSLCNFYKTTKDEIRPESLHERWHWLQGVGDKYGDFVSFLVWFPGNLYLPNRGVSYSTISWMTKKQLQFTCFAPKFTSGCEYLLKNTPKYMHQYESEFRWSILIQVINMS